MLQTHLLIYFLITGVVMLRNKLLTTGVLRKIRLSMILSSVLLLFGCREYSMYTYKPVVVPLLGGELSIVVQGSYGENYSEDGKEKADYSYPYALIFGVNMPLEFELSKLAVTNIELLGESSQRLTSLPDLESHRVYEPSEIGPNSTFRSARALISSLDSETLEYENYLLTATIVVFEDDEIFREESISIRLLTNFHTERRSDWFDEEMSV